MTPPRFVVTFESGGYFAMEPDVDFAKLSEEDREFVLSIIYKMKEYAESRPAIANPEPETCVCGHLRSQHGAALGAGDDICYVSEPTTCNCVEYEPLNPEPETP